VWPVSFQKILVAIDGSPGGAKALDTAIELAKLTGASLHALAVEGRLPAYAATIGEVDEVKREKDTFFATLARQAQAKALAQGMDLEVDVRPGHAAELIVRRAEQGNFDLVVVGHKGHFLEDYLLGSTADRVAHHAACPVMIVK
jgi:nucleotide-binding universal stress UspA family protein